MKTLIFINGPMGVGKTAVCEKLLEQLERSVYLDGDWCWNMHPFLVTDETKAMVLDNITAVLARFLACTELDYVVFGWVMHQPEIAHDILSRLRLDGVNIRQYTLLCSENVLIDRISQDIQVGKRTVGVTKKSLSYLPLYDGQNTIKIITDDLSPEEIAAQIVQKEVNP